MLGTLNRIWGIWGEAKVTSHSAATAYYAVFSLAPLILIAIALAGLVFGAEAAQRQVLDQLGASFGDEARGFLETVMAARDAETGGVLASVVGAVLVILGANGIFSALQGGLDEIFEVLPDKPKEGFLRGLLRKLVSFGLILSVGFLLVVSLLLSTLLAAVGGALRSAFPGSEVVVGIVDFVVSYALISLFLAAVIHFLPSDRVPWLPSLKGGLVAGALFVVGKYALGFYFAFAHPENPYGAASSVVLVILWAYYLSLTLFLSAIITRVVFVTAKDTAGEAGEGEPGAAKKSGAVKPA